MQRCEVSRERTILLNLQDKDAQFINGLTATDLTITEDNAPLNIIRLETITNVPVSAVILIDNSWTQYFTFSQAKLAAQKFVEWNLQNKNDRAALVSFAVDATVEEDLGSDWTKLLSSISKLKLEPSTGYPPGPVTIGRTPPIRPTRQGTTAIADAVWAATDGILKSATNSRRMIVVLTDGEDWTSITRLSEAIAYAGTNDVAVFAIDMKLEGHMIAGRTALTALAEDTGGRSFGLRKIQDLPEVLQKLDRQIRSHYALTYCTPDPSARKPPAKIEIEIKNSELRNAAKRVAYPRLAL
ncbi:MAG TPA: VWA domain-containing protein [Pyrinomonadaceae bacterium]|nr:VWA domain-containing protein [Pyrinomonadaceae bacterium]